VTIPVSAEHSELREQAIQVLCSDELEPIVEMVIFSPGADTYEARAVDGSVRARRRRAPADGDDPFEVVAVEGRNPLGEQDPTRFSPLAEELAHRQPDRSANSYPLAFERLSHVFDHPCAPDLCVLHTASHRPTDHRGEHGSLGVVQSRAPMIAWGAGVGSRGMVPGHCRLVDVAPTVLTLLGCTPGNGIGPRGEEAHDRLLARQDGEPVTDIAKAGGRACKHVVVVLMDGANANAVYAAASSGEAPTLSRLIAEGTALAHGAFASLPTVTLANHTSLNTGAHPGHHGVLHNAWYDRQLGREVVTESPTTWQESMRWLFPGIETIHEAVHRHRPDAVSAAVNEPADRGADYSTFDYFRRDALSELFADLPRTHAHADPEWIKESKDYQWATAADSSALHQASSIWRGEHLGRQFEPPTFMWVSFSLTDFAFHEGGPYSEIAQASLRDTDARLGDLLSAIEDRGVLDETALLVVADHGMEETAEEHGGDWGDALRAAGIEHRDEASGFIYLGVGQG